VKTVAGRETHRQKLEELKGNEQPQTIRVAVPFQLKSLNDETRTIEFIGSTPTKDRYGDVIEQNWELGAFLNNPVVPWAHDYHQPPVAKALEVGYVNGNLSFKAQFATADEYAWADTIYKLYRGGYLRAFSVGFIPLEYDGNWEDGYTFQKSELLEVSCVTVPANPEALVLAYKEGVISEDERKSMVGQAQKLIKTLTKDGDKPHSENVEVEALRKTLEDQIVQLKAATDALNELVALIKEANEEDEKVDPEDPEEPAEPEQPASGGTEDDEDEDDIDPDELKSVVGDAVKGALDYQLGKVT
jgi:uncharacterized protein